MGLDCGTSKTLDMKVFVILLLVGVVLAQKGTPPSKGGKGGKGGWSPPSGWTPPPKGDTGGSKGGKGGKGGWTPPPKSTPTGGNGGKGGNGGNGGSGGNTPTEAPVDPDEKPTDPTKCSDANQGRCDCGDESKGFTTYTFWQFDVQRCFTVYQPLDRAGQVLPVVFAPNCQALKERVPFPKATKLLLGMVLPGLASPPLTIIGNLVTITSSMMTNLCLALMMTH